MPPPLDVTLPPLTNADTAGARVAWPVAPAAAMPVPYASPFAATIAFAFSIAVSATFPVAVTVALLLEAEVAGATRTVATAPAAAKPTRPSDADQLFTVAVPDDVSVAFSVRAPPTPTEPPSMRAVVAVVTKTSWTEPAPLRLTVPADSATVS